MVGRLNYLQQKVRKTRMNICKHQAFQYSTFRRYKGPTLVEVIDQFKCPERPVDQPFRFSVNDIYKGTGSGFCVSGHVETGMVTTGDKVLVLPHTEVAFVKGLF